MTFAWTSADLLTRFNAFAGRPATDAITDATKYQYLGDGQLSVFTKIMSIMPKMQLNGPIAMSTADSGLTWTYGTDTDGNAIVPLGKAKLFNALSSVPFSPLRPGIDYMDEGTKVRMPAGVPWAGPLYWYGVGAPQTITAAIQPVLQPPHARILIVIEAVREFAESYARNPDLAAMMDRRWDREFGPSMTMMRTHLRGTGSGGIRGYAGIGLWGGWGNTGVLSGVV